MNYDFIIVTALFQLLLLAILLYNSHVRSIYSDGYKYITQTAIPFFLDSGDNVSAQVLDEQDAPQLIKWDLESQGFRLVILIAFMLVAAMQITAYFNIYTLMIIVEIVASIVLSLIVLSAFTLRKRKQKTRLGVNSIYELVSSMIILKELMSEHTTEQLLESSNSKNLFKQPNRDEL